MSLAIPIHYLQRARPDRRAAKRTPRRGTPGRPGWGVKGSRTFEIAPRRCANSDSRRGEQRKAALCCIGPLSSSSGQDACRLTPPMLREIGLTCPNFSLLFYFLFHTIRYLSRFLFIFRMFTGGG